MAFWISLIILLLPSDEKRQAEFYSKAAGALTWTMTFCERNGETCAKGGEFWTSFKAKAEFGGKVLADLVHGSISSGVETVANPTKQAPQQPTVSPASGYGSLSPDDLTQKWRGPIKSPRG